MTYKIIGKYIKDLYFSIPNAKTFFLLSTLHIQCKITLHQSGLWTSREPLGSCCSKRRSVNLKRSPWLRQQGEKCAPQKNPWVAEAWLEPTWLRIFKFMSDISTNHLSSNKAEIIPKAPDPQHKSKIVFLSLINSCRWFAIGDRGI